MPAVLVLFFLAAAGLWIYGEVANVRLARIVANLALLIGVGAVGAAMTVGTSFQLGSEYAERLEPFRAAAVERIEAGDCDRTLAELRALEGQFSYESGLAFEALEAATARLNEAAEKPATPAASAVDGAGAARSPK